MFIAHLPAGYICSTLLLQRFKASAVNAKAYVASGMIGAIAPDLDMFYFYFIDHGRHNHHSYFTHFPLVWIALLSCSAIWFCWGRAKPMAAITVVFFLNGTLHMVLDTVVGSIQWLAPFFDRYFAFFPISARYQPWWLNFILHWSFTLEIGILTYAIWLWRRFNEKKCSARTVKLRQDEKNPASPYGRGIQYDR